MLLPYLVTIFITHAFGSICFVITMGTRIVSIHPKIPNIFYDVLLHIFLRLRTPLCCVEPVYKIIGVKYLLQLTCFQFYNSFSFLKGTTHFFKKQHIHQVGTYYMAEWLQFTLHLYSQFAPYC